eukprot:s5535_g4.t1
MCGPGTTGPATCGLLPSVSTNTALGPQILGDAGKEGSRAARDEETKECEAWANSVLHQLQLLAGDRAGAGQGLLPAGAPLCSDTPFGLFHAVRVWPDGTRATQEDLNMRGSGVLSEAGTSSEDQQGADEDIDAFSAMSTRLALSAVVARVALGFDEPFDGTAAPEWWWDMVDRVRQFVDRGVEAVRVADSLESYHGMMGTSVSSTTCSSM